MNPQKQKRIGKFLSLVLRHKPETIGITLSEEGWTPVDDLLKNLSQTRHAISFEELELLVKNNPKQRYKLSEDGKYIRANQGHSVPVSLGYEPVVPPETLFHGTATRFVDSIKKSGLQKQSRHQVHLSKDLETASMVGKRHGQLVILEIKAGEMHRQGHNFYCSDNGVWLTDQIPVEFIEFPN